VRSAGRTMERMVVLQIDAPSHHDLPQDALTEIKPPMIVLPRRAA